MKSFYQTIKAKTEGAPPAGDGPKAGKPLMEIPFTHVITEMDQNFGRLVVQTVIGVRRLSTQYRMKDDEILELLLQHVLKHL